MLQQTKHLYFPVLNKKQLVRFFILLLLVFLSGKKPVINIQKTFTVIPVAYIPASFPVNFALFTTDKQQYLAFYDSAHQMNIASRSLNNPVWDFNRLDSKVGWDSHNYLSLAVDKEGFIHLAGNMHSSPLVYFRSKVLFDIHSMQPFHTMTGNEEDLVTYPIFMNGPDGKLLFHYRYGRSGSGVEIFNCWNEKSHKWERLLDKPLTDGRGKMNAYMQGPVPGPDGYYHIIWVWRNTPDCATNHTLSYARSKDLLNWESIRGEKIELPITIDYRQLYVDTTPVNGGLINIGIKLGFDATNKPIIGYHKYDSLGNTQLFLARYQNGNWTSRQVTHWNYRWDFKGYGTIVNELLIDAPKPSLKKGNIVFGYHHIKYGNGQVLVDDKTLKPLKAGPIENDYPPELDSVSSSFSGMVVNKVFDAGNAPKGKRYLLRWETLPPNRDAQRKENLPPDALLELIEY